MNPIVSNGNKLRWKFENVRELTAHGMFSEKFTLQNIDWKIYIRAFTENGEKYFAIYLYYDGKNINENNWICETENVFKLMRKDMQDLTKESSSLHEANQPISGYWKFIKWSELTYGYLKCDSIVVEIDFSFKYHDFSKNIRNFTDITINVNGTKFYVNKGILCAKSRYFYTLFVTRNSQKTTIKMKDVDVKDFRYLIASFCPLFQPTQLDNYKKLMELADKFEVPTLHAICENYLISSTEITLTDKLKLADQNDYYALMKSCIKSLENMGQLTLLQRSIEFYSFKTSTKLAIFTRIFEI